MSLTPAITAAFSYDPPVTAETRARWQAELDTIRQGEHVSALKLVWEPGDPWGPCGRWFLYDCVPGHVLYEGAARWRKAGRMDDENPDQYWLDQLNGPSPRERGYYDAVLGEFIQSPDTTLTLTQWRLWQTDRVFGHPFWVIQGAHGGHRWRFSREEQRALSQLKLPSTAPAPGSLPYAAWDQRVLLAVMRYDRLQRVQDRLSRDAEQAHHADQIRKLRKSYLTSLEDQVRDLVRGSRIDMGDARRVEGDVTPVPMEVAEEQFINRGL